MYYGQIDRRESVKITLLLDKSATERHRTNLAALKINPDPVTEGDTLVASYQFSVAYFDGVVLGLGAICGLVSDEAIVRDVEVSELIHGRSVILEVAAKLTRLIDKLENKPCPKRSKRGWWRLGPSSTPAES